MAIVAILAVTVLAGCGSSNGTSSSTSSSSPGAGGASPGTSSAEAQIRSNWQRFFSGQTGAAAKVALLQNGQRFANVIKAQAATPLGKGVGAQVTSVKMVSPTKATVTYTITIAGKPVLKNATGQAVLQNGTWKVGTPSFQGLLRLMRGSGGTSASPSP